MSESASAARAEAGATASVNDAIARWYAATERAGQTAFEASGDGADDETEAALRARLGDIYDTEFDQGRTDAERQADENAQRLIEFMVATGNMPKLDENGLPVMDGSHPGIGGRSYVGAGAVAASKDYHILDPNKLAKIQESNPELYDAYTNVAGSTLRERASNAFSNIYGQGFREVRSSNSGDVPYLLDCNGMMWCGGAEWGFDAVISGGQLYNQDSFRSAASFLAQGVKYNAYVSASDIDANDPSTWPKPGDTIMVPGAGPSGLHPLTVGAVDPRTGMITIGAGNHSNALALRQIPITSSRIKGYVSKDALLFEKALRGEAVLDGNGQPILSMDQQVTMERQPHEWVKDLYENQPDKVVESRAMGKAMAQALDANGDGKLTSEDIAAARASGGKLEGDALATAIGAARAAGLTIDGDVDTIPEYIAVMQQAVKAQQTDGPQQ